MATLYVTEFVASSSGIPAAVQPPVAEQTVAIAGASAQSSAFNAATTLIRLHTDAVCSIEIGLSPTATTAKARMAADQTEYFRVTPGQQVAVISNT